MTAADEEMMAAADEEMNDKRENLMYNKTRGGITYADTWENC